MVSGKLVFLLSFFLFFNIKSSETSPNKAQPSASTLLVENIALKEEVSKLQALNQHFNHFFSTKSNNFNLNDIKSFPLYQSSTSNEEEANKILIMANDRLKELNIEKMKLSAERNLVLSQGFFITKQFHNALKMALSVIQNPVAHPYVKSEAKLIAANIYLEGYEGDNIPANQQIPANETIAAQLYKEILKEPLNASTTTRNAAEEKLDFIEFDEDNVYLIDSITIQEKLRNLIEQVTHKSNSLETTRNLDLTTSESIKILIKDAQSFLEYNKNYLEKYESNLFIESLYGDKESCNKELAKIIYLLQETNKGLDQELVNKETNSSSSNNDSNGGSFIGQESLL